MLHRQCGPMDGAIAYHRLDELSYCGLLDGHRRTADRQTEERTDGVTGGRTDGRAGERTEERTDRRTKERKTGGENGRSKQRTYGRTNERTNGRKDGQTSEWKVERTKAGKDGRTDERTDERMKEGTDERRKARRNATVISLQLFIERRRQSRYAWYSAINCRKCIYRSDSWSPINWLTLCRYNKPLADIRGFESSSIGGSRITIQVDRWTCLIIGVNKLLL